MVSFSKSKRSGGSALERQERRVSMNAVNKSRREQSVVNAAA